MKITKIISSLLAVLMLMSAFTLVMSADEIKYEYNTTNEKPTISYLDGAGLTPILDDEGNPTGKYESDKTRIIYTKEDKLETMDLRYAKDGYELYVDAYSGEVATRCVATGEILFSNPYNIVDSSAKDTVKKELLSQLVVKYVDVTEPESKKTFHSFEEAAERGQIVVRNIKNGIRVEYTIGREEARMLVPRLITKESFEKKILTPIFETIGFSGTFADLSDAPNTGEFFKAKQILAYYSLKDPSRETDKVAEQMLKDYPITKKKVVYAIDASTTSVEIAKIEQFIKTYCPDYSYEDLDDDHMDVEYEAEDKNPPLFKMALEYSIDANGMTVRLPANGIRFNEALYQLISVDILPYMGAGYNSNKEDSVFLNNSGYTFFPDGSGSLFDFGKITDIGSATTITGKVYGIDYAYHQISGTHQEVIRYPVFGIVNTEDADRIQRREDIDEKKKAAGDPTLINDSDIAVDESNYPGDERTSGFVAIVEEGDALMELSVYHAVQTSDYNTIKMTVYPRPQDTYNVADAISVGENDTWTVVSSRKYTGNYKVRYIMLTDDEVAAEKGISKYYDCSYTGMAKAYREYLESSGVLTRLTADDVKNQIPLYIETFGALETTERFLSIPVDVMAPLTTFADIKTMRTELSEKGINNINFILTGYTKGGISEAQVPYNLKWEKAVEEGGMNFEELLEEARANGYGVYPDFDFAYAHSNKAFDGLTMKDHSVKTIDDRYTTKREYSATKQTYISYFDIAISPAYFNHFYNKLVDNYLEYAPMGISVSTLGNTLNSDFDEDEPYNREDSKKFTAKAFADIKALLDDGKIITSGGNAYTWQYVDYITDIALDSSRFAQSSASVPFLGMVLHGYREIAGTPINMEGNIEYALLKAIENGASLKFTLSYNEQNISKLKNFEDLSKYYSVRYDIWFDDVVDIYTELNSLLADVQTSTIVEHEVVGGIRVPDDDELINDAMNAIDKAIENSNDYRDALDAAKDDEYRNARLEIDNILKEFKDATSKGTFQTLTDSLKSALTNINGYKVDGVMSSIEADFNRNVLETKKELDAVENTSSKEYAEKLQKYNAGVRNFKKLLSGYQTSLDNVEAAANALLNEANELQYKLNLVNGKYKTLIEEDYAGGSGSLTKAEYEAMLIKIAEINVESEKSRFMPDVIDTYKALFAESYNNITNPNDKVKQKAYYDAIQERADEIKAEVASITDYVAKQTAAVNILVNDKYAEIRAALVACEAKADPAVFKEGEFASNIDDESYAYIPVETDEGLTPPEKVETPVYGSDESKIVYEVYENGTAFLLNFNNYTVKTEEINGVSYIIDAYGYVVIAKAN